MSKLMESIDARTKLVGENRLELLLFRLAGRQMYALNVFKIQEVVQIPPITIMPHRHAAVRGVTHLRDQTISVIDLSAAIGLRPLPDITTSNMIVTEYNRSIQGFLVRSVDRIVNLNWEVILPPPSGSGRSHFLTAITHIDNQIVEVLDVERVLADIIPYDTRVSQEVLDAELAAKAKAANMTLLMADDSSTALGQVRDTLKHLGVTVIGVQDGLQALTLLRRWLSEGVDVYSHIFMLITDAEMPEMDGYRLTHEIRNDPRLKDLYVVLHTSLSGSFNNAMVEKVGCNGFLSKFQPDSLAELVQNRLREHFASR
ncbi:chemotaxis protein CheV [Simiduia aestuariiviva]|uniref:Two-component system chemotaxis response regulator CheV n=1 Tax=Simiduia aestuariiviva TaxID=1510459 RepID=A0A839UPY1_9GAMM|nr:chemotaxis protein CheV [Simiduia aestuariiviva]MBB3168529.1 two-component system chemotaxis response regulator CheV [Simiduia aestuariiviva]